MTTLDWVLAIPQLLIAGILINLLATTLDRF
jgi:hypothetical protein